VRRNSVVPKKGIDEATDRFVRFFHIDAVHEHVTKVEHIGDALTINVANFVVVPLNEPDGLLFTFGVRFW
jgi:hypothetical protein